MVEQFGGDLLLTYVEWIDEYEASLAADPDARYRSMEDFLNAIRFVKTATG